MTKRFHVNQKLTKYEHANIIYSEYTVRAKRKLEKRKNMVIESSSGQMDQSTMIGANSTKQSRKKKRKRTANVVSGDGVVDTSTKTIVVPHSTSTNCTSTTIESVSNDKAKQNYQPLNKKIRTSNHHIDVIAVSTNPSNAISSTDTGSNTIVVLNRSSKKYVTIHDGSMYHELLQNVYIGFSYVPAAQIQKYMNQPLTTTTTTTIPMELPSSTLLLSNPNSKNKNHDCENHFHIYYQNVLQSLYDYYQYDIIMPGGKHSSRTFVRRTLVGEPGMTYKYLGLRLFTHAWRSSSHSSPDNDDSTTTSKKESNKVSSLFHNVYKLNQAMIQMTEHQVQIYQERTGKLVPKQLYDYNLTLINYMEPCNDVTIHNNNPNTSSSGHHQKHQPLRDEEFYNMGKASVSWHADSSLQDNSCIGVYHTLFQNTLDNKCTYTSNQKRTTGKFNDGNIDTECTSNDEHDWKIALRPNPTATTIATSDKGKKGRFGAGDKNMNTKRIQPNTKGPATPPPPIVVSTKSGDVYFLLDEFNHKFQHMVLAGSNHQYRISSTHRVAVTTTDTYQYIAKACSTALLSSKAEMKKSPQNIYHWDTAILLQTQTVLNEVEFEWIAQYWIQGAQHDVQHSWWQKPMRALEDAWNALEKVTYKIYTNIVTAFVSAEDDKKCAPLPSRALVQGLLQSFQHRQELRLKWDHRRADKIYKRRISIPYQPVERPMFPPISNNNNNKTDLKQQQKQLPKDLSDAIQTLSDLLQLKYPPKIGKQHNSRFKNIT